jgi:hypothetical protein
MTPEDSEEESAPEPDPFALDDDDEPLPPRQELHAVGQLAAGVLAVVVLIAAVLATSALLTWVFR